MTDKTLFITACVGYLALLIVFSKLIARRMAGLSDFFLAGHKLPWVAIGLACVASYFGAGSTIGTMNDAYSKGLSAIWLIFIPAMLACYTVAFAFAKKIRRINSLSMPDAIEAHYGPIGRLGLAIVLLATTTTFIASQLFAAGQLVALSMGLPALWSVGAVLAVIITYSIIGGFRAVVMTDFLQFACFTSAVLLLFGFSVFSGHSSSPVLKPDFWSPWVGLKNHLAMTLTFVCAWSIAPELWQRMMACHDERDAQKSAFLGATLLAGLYMCVILAGMFAVYHVPHGSEANQNILWALAKQLPSPLLTAAVLVGVMSAITSTIDSSMNVGSLTLTHDIIQRYFWSNATPKQLVLLSRLALLVIGLPGAAIALYYGNLIQILWISADIYASTMFIPMMGVFYWPKAGHRAGVLAMSLGAIPVLLNFAKDLHWIHLPAFWPEWPYTTLLGITLSALGFATGWVLQKREPLPTVEASG